MERFKQFIPVGTYAWQYGELNVREADSGRRWVLTQRHYVTENDFSYIWRAVAVCLDDEKAEMPNVYGFGWMGPGTVLHSFIVSEEDALRVIGKDPLALLRGQGLESVMKDFFEPEGGAA